MQCFPESEGARAERTKSHPIDLKIHDAFLVAAALEPAAYRAWCGERGVALLNELAAARRAIYKRACACLKDLVY